ncbi:NTF2-like domain [Phytophthora cactorum]|nr:NTF2-like domain [Phytophthora cactorum]
MDRVSSIFRALRSGKLVGCSHFQRDQPRAAARVRRRRGRVLRYGKDPATPSNFTTVDHENADQSIQLPHEPIAPMEVSLSRRRTTRLYAHLGAQVRSRTRLVRPPQPAPTEEPVRSVASSSPTLPHPKRASRTVPSVKTIQSTVPGAPKPKRKRIRIKTPRRREQCRTNQARYRQKQTQYAKNLEIAAEQLRQEIPMLEMQHSRLISNAKPSAAVFLLLSTFISSVWLQKSEVEQQLVFLRSSMTEDVVLGELRGVDALVEQWKRYTSYFDDLQFHLEHMTTLSEDFIAATASLNVTISRSTLQYVFPICWLWDRSSKRIARMENTVDILPSLVQVIGSIEDAAFVLEQALIAQDSAIGHNN